MAGIRIWDGGFALVAALAGAAGAIFTTRRLHLVVLVGELGLSIATFIILLRDWLDLARFRVTAWN